MPAFKRLLNFKRRKKQWFANNTFTFLLQAKAIYSFIQQGIEASCDCRLCRYFSGFILGALQEEDRETLLSPLSMPVKGTAESFPLSERLFEVAYQTKKQAPFLDT